MGPTIGIVRWLAVIAAASFFVAALLFLGLTFNVFVKPPDIPASADLPTNLLAAVPAIHAMWPFDAVSSLLFGVGFGALALLGRPLASLVPAGRGGATLIGPALLGGGVLGVAAQLIHVGAQQLVVDIPYCDCGFKVQETISQHWALVLIGGAQSLADERRRDPAGRRILGRGLRPGRCGSIGRLAGAVVPDGGRRRGQRHPFRARARRRSHPAADRRNRRDLDPALGRSPGHRARSRTDEPGRRARRSRIRLRPTASPRSDRGVGSYTPMGCQTVFISR